MGAAASARRTDATTNACRDRLVLPTLEQPTCGPAGSIRSNHPNGVADDASVQVSLVIPGSGSRLQVAVLVCRPGPQSVVSWPGTPIDVPSDPGLCNIGIPQTGLLPRDSSVQTDLDLLNLAVAGPGPAAEQTWADRKLPIPRELKRTFHRLKSQHRALRRRAGSVSGTDENV